MVTTLALCVGVLVAFISTPIYKADALLQVEDKNKGLSALQDVQSFRGDSPTVSAELEILGSRMIPGGLSTACTSSSWSAALRADRRRRDRTPLSGRFARSTLLGLSKYAWGGERIRLESPPCRHRCKVRRLPSWRPMPTVMSCAPRRRRNCSRARRRAGAEGRPEGLRFRTEGAAWHRVRGAASQSRASYGRPPCGALRLPSGAWSGVIGATLTGPDQEALPRVLDDVINAYVRQNVEYRSAEAEHAALSRNPVAGPQEPARRCRSGLQQHRQTRGSVDLTIETQSVLARSSRWITRSSPCSKARRAAPALYRRAPAGHGGGRADRPPAYCRARGLDKDVSRPPDTQQTALRLKRDVEVSTALYTSLLNSAQQLRVARAGTVGDARIIDAAVVGSARWRRAKRSSPERAGSSACC